MGNLKEIGELFWGSGAESGKDGVEGDRRDSGNERASSVTSAGSNRGVNHRIDGGGLGGLLGVNLGGHLKIC
jgi:hypothetical protein